MKTFVRRQRPAYGELIGALVATALVLMAVFVPVAILPPVESAIYKQFGPHDRLLDLRSPAFNASPFRPCSPD